MTSRRNIGIFAHVDAGKTSTTEQMLYHAGALRSRGRVDDGTAATDDLAFERQRGISIRSKCARFSWRGVRVQLIDTPGHTDFAGEAERAMWALDGAILLVSAAEGIQSYTVLLARYLAAAGLPYLVFINKSDYPAADIPGILDGLARRLEIRAVDMSDESAVIESAAELDDELMERYFAGDLRYENARRAVMRASCEGRVHPVLTGSALRDTGIDDLLDAVVDGLPEPEAAENAPLSGVVFGIEQDKAMGRGAHVRLFSGAVRVRDALPRQDRPAAKLTQIRPLGVGGGREEMDYAEAGDIVTLYGMADAKVGDVIGDPALLPRPVRPGELQKPLMMVRVSPKNEGDLTRLREALLLLTAENPLLDLEWDAVCRQLRVRIMGVIQTEVLAETLRDRFGIEADILDPTILYRETPARAAEGFYAYTMPKPCWAILRFHIEPLPRGSGVVYEDTVPPARLSVRYRKQVEQTIPRALRQGNFGWEVTDVRITLIDGQDHQWHTHPLDFALCTPIAILDGIRRAGSILLEPMLTASLSVPRDMAGRVLGDIAQMRGTAGDSRDAGDLIEITAQLPAAEAMDYPVRFASMTSGRGVLVTRFAGYRECPVELGRTAEYRGVHPLDTAKYILAMRSALSEENDA